MIRLPPVLLAILVLLATCVGLAASEPEPEPEPELELEPEPDRKAPARRVVSLNPSLTETLIALGAADSLVGVDDYSARTQPAVKGLPTVGGLFNPSLEAVVALEPDLVVAVPSAQQRDLRSRLEELGVAVLELPNVSLDEALDSIEIVGERVGRGPEARARVREIRTRWQAMTQATSGLAPVTAVLVLQRDPLYVVGRGSFIDSMLRAAGARNLADEFTEPYPRAALEWLIASAPQVILDSSDDPQRAPDYWSRWPSLPAVKQGRVVTLPRGVTLPGPYLDRSLQRMAEAVHGEAPGGEWH